MSLSTAKELDLFDYEVPEGTAISVMPPAREYMQDPFWYDSGGRNPFHRKRVHKMSAGEERKRKLREVLTVFPRYGPSMHEWAVDQNDPSLIRELLQVGASLDIREAKRRKGDGEGASGEETDDESNPRPTLRMQPALHVAAFEGKLECVKVIVQDGHVDVNDKDENDTTALTNALIKGHEQVVDWLLAHGCNITFEARQLTDLQAALRSSKVALAKKVLEQPQSVEHKLRIEPSHLPWAAWSMGDPLDMDAITRSLEFAVAAASIESVLLMLPFLTQRNDVGSFEYVELPDADQISLFNATEDALTKRDAPDLFELIWETFLCRSDRLGKGEKQVTITREDELNRRLISACTRGCLETCRLLVEKYGADVEHVSHKYFTTPLGRAVGSTEFPVARRLPVVRYLLEEKHVSIHLADGEFSNGPTPLAQAIQTRGNDHGRVIKLLLKSGGPLEGTDSEVSETVKAAEAGTTLKLHLVLRPVPRYPIRLMTDDQVKSEKAEGKSRMVEVETSKAEWEVWLASMQIRKSNEKLAAEDPKGRPLELE